ncbi:hypothetical protein [Deinococcus wulumuqiensis]|uniref:hypothetical protein n=1 Tax=Deinococcus wulumuqiensis TaxID=980427 RepID=UPI00242FF6F4|nr:hypothetical protein [Deinococcus wulumuqiensis]
MDADALQKVLKANSTVREQHFRDSERFLNSALAKMKAEASRKGVIITTSTRTYPHIIEGFVVADLIVNVPHLPLKARVGVRKAEPKGFEVFTPDEKLSNVMTEEQLIALMFLSLQNLDVLRTQLFTQGIGQPSLILE